MKSKPEKNSGLNGIQTHDLCDTGVVLYQLSYQSNWELIMCEFVMVKNASEYMKDHIFELRRKIWKHDWSSQLYTQLQQLWNESLKKFRPERDFEPMISAIPVQCSTGWRLIILWVRYIPVDRIAFNPRTTCTRKLIPPPWYKGEDAAPLPSFRCNKGCQNRIVFDLWP